MLYLSVMVADTTNWQPLNIGMAQTQPVYEKFPVSYPMSTYCATVNTPWEEDTTITGYLSGYNSYKAWKHWKWIKRGNDGGTAATGCAPSATAMSAGIKSAKNAVGIDKGQ